MKALGGYGIGLCCTVIEWNFISFYENSSGGVFFSKINDYKINIYIYC